jgi:hypothetical protein
LHEAEGGAGHRLPRRKVAEQLRGFHGQILPVDIFLYRNI